jgi:oligoribonuclease
VFSRPYAQQKVNLMPAPKPVFVWIDLEMTGLDPKTCSIVEMAVIVTDHQLEPLAPPLELVIWQPDEVLARMTPFVRELHTKTGLLEKIRRSEVSVDEAQQEALKLVSKYAPFRTARLCGNSVYTDRSFLAAYMPQLEGWLHYRQIDVSTLKELGNAWNDYKYRKGDGPQHTALYDIQQSIEELKNYRTHLWRAS